MSQFYYGEYGGRFVPETLIPALLETGRVFDKYRNDPVFYEKV